MITITLTQFWGIASLVAAIVTIIAQLWAIYLALTKEPAPDSRWVYVLFGWGTAAAAWVGYYYGGVNFGYLEARQGSVILRPAIPFVVSCLAAMSIYITYITKERQRHLQEIVELSNEQMRQRRKADDILTKAEIQLQELERLRNEDTLTFLKTSAVLASRDDQGSA